MLLFRFLRDFAVYRASVECAHTGSCEKSSRASFLKILLYVKGNRIFPVCVCYLPKTHKKNLQLPLPRSLEKSFRFFYANILRS